MTLFFDKPGYCPICEGVVRFTSKQAWFRDHLLCSKCRSIPRERALYKVVTDYFSDYRDLCIHESSPGGRGASVKFHQVCKGYSASQFYSNVDLGQVHPQSGYRCENLECLSFPDESFDLFITQDVMEHIFNPEKAFKEIARVLKPGGAHVFTVPLINKASKSECWASRTDVGEIIYHHEAEYHGNPVDVNGSLVTMHWGFDIAGYISDVANTPTSIVIIDDIHQGIRAEYIEVLISRKLISC